MNRINKTDYYLDIAETTSKRSTCLKRQYGAIIVKDDEVISSGFNGAPRGVISCIETDKCYRVNAKRGTDYCNCVSVHAEQNAIISAPRSRMIGSTMYLVGIENHNWYVDNASPCALCKRMIINAGIEKVVVRINKEEFQVFDVDTWKNSESITGGY